LPQTPAVAAAPPDPGADPSATKNADGFPNLNAPVHEPASKLLPDEERARVIAELEALRKKGETGSKDGGGADAGKKGKSKLASKCQSGGSAASDPACKQ
jgi:hypothetical protein